jgi:hypothetical protein
LKIKSVLLALLCTGWLSAQTVPNLAKIDARAVAAPASVERDLQSLVNYLCPRHYSEAQKARSLFRWVCARVRYDVAALRRGELGPQDPEHVLRTRLAVCEGYAELYKALGDLAGLQVHMVTGDSKFNKELGLKLPPNVQGHAWNAVLLDGRWRLLDPTWAAGKVTPTGVYKAAFDDFWFSTPPEYFAYTHLPKDERWQLLDKPMTARRFEALPRLSSDFFRLGLRLGPDQGQPLKVQGEKTLRWTVPKDVVFISQLEDESGRELDGYTFTQSPDGRVETRFRCPRKGRYRLTLFARKRERAWETDPKAPQKYNGVAVYEVEAGSGSKADYPKTFGSFQRGGAELLGPFDGALRAGSQQQFNVRAPGAEEVVVFQDGILLTKLSGGAGQFSGRVSVPSRGPLQLFARYPKTDRYWGLLEYSIR